MPALVDRLGVRRRRLRVSPEGQEGEPEAETDERRPWDEDLVPDHAISSPDQDRFGHPELAREIALLSASADTPIVIAIYAPWGAGKTSFAGLVKHYLPRGLFFSRFDAWEKAEPRAIQRGFLTLVKRALYQGRFLWLEAFWLKVRLRRGLAIRVQRARVQLGPVLGALFLVVAVVWWFSARDSFGDIKRLVEPILGILATVGFFTLITRLFTQDIEESIPTEAEQFGDLFRRIAIRASKKAQDEGRHPNLVFFVDELDRCTPDEVVGVLESLRTFLRVENCVFLVAADKAVIERAASKEARQSSPGDAASPYFSSGSAYLDKIFQHQLELPPLSPQRLARFASDLVDGRGLWAGANFDLPGVVSTLVPSHVQSPRRVKALLNSFVAYWRNLESVAAARPATTPKPLERQLEIAKLVCLQAEWPEFARVSLHVPGLIDKLTSAFEGTSELEDTLAQFNSHEWLPQAAREAVSDMLRGNRATEVWMEPQARDRISPEQKEHAALLFRYLVQTSSIRGPLVDLVMMEAPGAPFDLEPSIAHEAQIAVFSGEGEAFKSLLSRVNAEEQVRLLDFASSLVVREAVGEDVTIYGDVVIKGLSELEDPASAAVAVWPALQRLQERRQLNADELWLALQVAEGLPPRTREQAEGELLSARLLRTDDDLLIEVLDEVSDLTVSGREVAQSLFAGCVPERPRVLQEIGEEPARLLVSDKFDHVLADFWHETATAGSAVENESPFLRAIQRIAIVDADPRWRWRILGSAMVQGGAAGRRWLTELDIDLPLAPTAELTTALVNAAAEETSPEIVSRLLDLASGSTGMKSSVPVETLAARSALPAHIAGVSENLVKLHAAAPNGFPLELVPIPEGENPEIEASVRYLRLLGAALGVDGLREVASNRAGDLLSRLTGWLASDAVDHGALLDQLERAKRLEPADQSLVARALLQDQASDSRKLRLTSELAGDDEELWVKISERARSLSWEEPDGEQLVLLALWLKRDKKGLAIPAMREVYSAIKIEGRLLDAAVEWRDALRPRTRTQEIRRLVKSPSLAAQEDGWFSFLGKAPFNEEEIGKSLSERLRGASNADEIESLVLATGLLHWTSRRSSTLLVKAAVQHAKSPHRNRVVAASRMLALFPPERSLEKGARQAARKAYLRALDKMKTKKEMRGVVESLLKGGHQVPAKYQRGLFARAFDAARKAILG